MVRVHDGRMDICDDKGAEIKAEYAKIISVAATIIQTSQEGETPQLSWDKRFINWISKNILGSGNKYAIMKVKVFGNDKINYVAVNINSLAKQLKTTLDFLKNPPTSAPIQSLEQVIHASHSSLESLLYPSPPATLPPNPPSSLNDHVITPLNDMIHEITLQPQTSPTSNALSEPPTTPAAAKAGASDTSTASIAAQTDSASAKPKLTETTMKHEVDDHDEFHDMNEQQAPKLASDPGDDHVIITDDQNISNDDSLTIWHHMRDTAAKEKRDHVAAADVKLDNLITRDNALTTHTAKTNGATAPLPSPLIDEASTARPNKCAPITSIAASTGRYLATKAKDAALAPVIYTASKIKDITKWIFGINNLQDAWRSLNEKTKTTKFHPAPDVNDRLVALNATEDTTLYDRLAPIPKQLMIAGFKAVPLWAYGLASETGWVDPPKNYRDIIRQVPLLIYKGQKYAASTVFTGVQFVTPIMVDRVVVPAAALLCHGAEKVAALWGVGLWTADKMGDTAASITGTTAANAAGFATAIYLCTDAWKDIMSIPKEPELQPVYTPAKAGTGGQANVEGAFRIKKGDHWIIHKIKKIAVAAPKVIAAAALAISCYVRDKDGSSHT